MTTLMQTPRYHRGISRVSTRPRGAITRASAALRGDPRLPCMACHRKPSEVIVDEQADDGGWTWVCRTCYGRRRGWAILGTVGKGEV